MRHGFDPGVWFLAVADGAAVLIELTPAPDVSATILHELLMSRNLAFL